ncbi:PAS domain S-box protein [Massilia niabensis]|uniref:histidine kinase n=1 Tax=Massilia niabensis TaxID=544910 RepID=A0ABW0LF08_9BURK
MNRRDSQYAFLANGGRMGERIRDMDWSAHPMGPVESWEPALRTSLGIMLSSSFPSFLAWGEDLALFFNDAYVPVLGQKSDWALGAPYAGVWHEVWNRLAPTIARVQGGESFFFENYATTLERHGYPEPAWFTFSYSPLRDEQGGVKGLICTVIEVTDKVQALARHKEAEERLAMSLEASGNIGTWSVDLDTYTTHVDERFARLFQVDAALARTGTELTRFTDLIHPDDRAGVTDAIGAAIRDGTLYDAEYRIPQRSGIDAWVNARGKVFTDPASGKRRFAGIAVDISVSKRAEQALLVTERQAAAASLRAEESRRRLDGLLEAAPVGIFYVDTSGRLLMSNAATRSLWGDYPASGGIEKYAKWTGWWPDGKPLAPQEWPLARVLGGEDIVEAIIEIEPFGNPGVRRMIMVRAQALRAADGAVNGAVAAHMDISAQVAAERALKDSEQKFRNITNMIPQMVWSINVEGTEDYVNERWQAFTGVAHVELARKGWQKVLHPDDLAPVLAAWKRSFAAGTPFEIEHRLVHHAGGYRWVLNRALPCTDGVGRVTHWMGTLTDIHDQKAGEEELRAASRRKDEFLAMLAHELRNPLAPISNAAQLIAMANPPDKRIRHSSDVITRQVRHMTELVDDLLDVSRVTRGLVTLEREPVDVRAIVLGAVEQARPLVEARGQQLTLELGEAGLRVDADRTRMVQVVSNLLNNAAKYTPQGGSIALSVSSHGGGEVTIAVADSGIGIAPDILPLVFDLFTQAERTPDRSQGGLGLGLALVKSLVQLHGGQVQAASAGLGKGSTFSVTLDVVAGVAPEAAPAAGQPEHGAGGGRRILIVDDNVDAAESLGEIMQAYGHAVATASTPYGGLAFAAGDWPDVFILDIGLPDIDGYELVRRLRALPQARPALFVALTGYGQAHDKVLSLGAGFDHHFVKPVDLAALTAVIEGART